MEPEEAKTISKYKDMYRSIMDGEPIEPNLVDLSAETLLAHRIEIRNLGEKQANIKDKKQLPVQKLHDSQSDIEKYKVTLSYFTIIIHVSTNYPTKFELQPMNNCGSGSYGIVVPLKNSMNEKLVTKIQFLKQNQTMTQRLIRLVVLEVAFLKLCSLLRIGPAIPSSSSQDLTVYENTINFNMQECLPVKTFRNNINEHQLQKDIRDCLRTLHGLQLIHADVKPQNMVYSYKYNKYVLCDFGLSNCLAQKFGWLTKTTCNGTMHYVCSQMRALENDKEDYVDLYYNDAYGLNKTIKQIIANKMRASENNTPYQQQPETCSQHFSIRHSQADLQIDQELDERVRPYQLEQKSAAPSKPTRIGSQYFSRNKIRNQTISKDKQLKTSDKDSTADSQSMKSINRQKLAERREIDQQDQPTDARDSKFKNRLDQFSSQEFKTEQQKQSRTHKMCQPMGIPQSKMI